jgi:hypothetical protein
VSASSLPSALNETSLIPLVAGTRSVKSRSGTVPLVLVLALVCAFGLRGLASGLVLARVATLPTLAVAPVR